MCSEDRFSCSTKNAMIYENFYVVSINLLAYPMSANVLSSLLCKRFVNHEFYELIELLFFEKPIKPQSGLKIRLIRLIRG